MCSFWRCPPLALSQRAAIVSPPREGPAGRASGGHQLQRPLEASVGKPAGGQRGEPAGDSEVPLNSRFILREIIVELDGFVFGEIFGRHGAGARRMFLKRFLLNDIFCQGPYGLINKNLHFR